MIDVFAPAPPDSALVAFICRCSTKEEHAARAVETSLDAARAKEQRTKQEAESQLRAANARAAEFAARSPDPGGFSVEEVEQVGAHLVMKVLYPNCAKCAYEGNKVMVFLDTTIAQAIRWRRIDPHFRAPNAPAQHARPEAPSPAARFPASANGWCDALTYARGKAR